ncbi:MAG: DUF748 domain-containing protein, partial [Rhodocyclaceae bacterium]|nr:DUF748 domain-containing protein [Rhodocyclaceae bacterium]
MPSQSSPRLVLARRLGLALVGLTLLVSSFLWLALPGILEDQAQRHVAEKTGYRLTFERPQINPLALSLRVTGLKLAAPDGAPLLACDELFVDLAAASLVKRMAIFDAIRLSGLSAQVVERPDGTTNWTPFVAALTRDEPPANGAKASLPRLEIRQFELTDGALDFADRRSEPGFATRIAPLTLSLQEVSTLPDDRGQWRLQAQTSIGAALELAGEAGLNPLRLTGGFTLKALPLAPFAPYLAALPGPPAGSLTVSARFRVGPGGQGLEAIVEDIQATLSALRLPLASPGAALEVAELTVRDGRFSWPRQEVGAAAIDMGGLVLATGTPVSAPRLGALRIENARADLAARSAAIGRVALDAGQIEVSRRADGRLDLVEAVLAALPAASDEPTPPWHYRVDRLELTRFAVLLRDAGIAPPLELSLDDFALAIEGLSDDLGAPLPLRVGFDIKAGGRFDGEGSLTPQPLAADLRLKLAEVSLLPAQGYLASKTTLTLKDGKLSTAGRLNYSAREGPRYRGDFAVRNLRLVDGEEPLLAWKSLATSELKLAAQRLDIGELRVNGLDTRLIIDKDKNINLKRVIKPAPPELSASSASAAPAPQPAQDFVVNIDRVRFYNGEIFFADYSLVLPFGTRIHTLRGGLGNLSSQAGRGAGQVEIEGEVDDYGLARAVGQVDFFAPTAFLDLRVLFKNVEMMRLTPYTATFAGRKIDSGKLSLDLHYQIKNRELKAANQIVMDRLVLGERVNSPSAQELPLDLAVAVLEDSDGRIDLGLPITGSLDDPQFSYGQIVWQAIKNVLTKIVTAPFRAIAALFGGNEPVEQVVFEAGAAQLTPPEREKLTRLAALLAKRPALVLEVRGTWGEADRVALQDLKLRRAIIEKMGERLPERGEPGPLSTAQPKVQAALEALYQARFGAAELAALKEGYRRANPGKLEEGVAGRMLARLTGLVREKKTLGEDEIERLKGADFYAVLFERLRAHEVVGEERLTALATARGENAVLALKAAGLA